MDKLFNVNGNVNGCSMGLKIEAATDYEARKEFRSSFDRDDNVVILTCTEEA